MKIKCIEYGYPENVLLRWEVLAELPRKGDFIRGSAGQRYRVMVVEWVPGSYEADVIIELKKVRGR